MTTRGLRKMMARFEATGLLSVAPGKEKKLTSVETEKDFALAMEEATIKSTHCACCGTSNGRTMEYGVQNYPRSAAVLPIRNQTYSKTSA